MLVRFQRLKSFSHIVLQVFSNIHIMLVSSTDVWHPPPSAATQIPRCPKSPQRIQKLNAKEEFI